MHDAKINSGRKELKQGHGEGETLIQAICLDTDRTGDIALVKEVRMINIKNQSRIKDQGRLGKARRGKSWDKGTAYFREKLKM